MPSISPQINVFENWSDVTFVQGVSAWDKKIKGYKSWRASLALDSADYVVTLATQRAYREDVTEKLSKLVKSHGYSRSLVDVFATILHETVVNAVIHGNLGLDIKMDYHDISDPVEAAEVMQDAFSQIDQALVNPKLGRKPIQISLSLGDDEISLAVRDDGDGFDFQTFQKKYKDVSLRKGMDFVLLLSKELNYDRASRTLSVTLRDPDKKRVDDYFVDMSKLVIGVCTMSLGYYEIFAAMLAKYGFLQTKNIHPLEAVQCAENHDLGLMIFLADIEPQLMRETVTACRQTWDQFDLPIFCQKSPRTNKKDLRVLGGLVNDFIEPYATMTELVTRIRAHAAMKQARDKMLSVYHYYQKENRYIQKTIHYLEQDERIDLGGSQQNPQAIQAWFQNSHTTQGTLMALHDMHARAIRYSHGFWLEVAGKQYAIMVTMPFSFSETMIVATLKAFVENPKRWDTDVSADDIKVYIRQYIDALIGDKDFPIKIFCCAWQPELAQLTYSQEGGFWPLCYHHETAAFQRPRVFDTQQEDVDRVLEIDTDTIYIFMDDAMIPDLDHLQIAIEQYAASPQSDSLNLRTAQNYRIPCLVLDNTQVKCP